MRHYYSEAYNHHRKIAKNLGELLASAAVGDPQYREINFDVGMSFTTGDERDGAMLRRVRVVLRGIPERPSISIDNPFTPGRATVIVMYSNASPDAAFETASEFLRGELERFHKRTMNEKLEELGFRYG